MGLHVQSFPVHHLKHRNILPTTRQFDAGYNNPRHGLDASGADVSLPAYQQSDRHAAHDSDIFVLVLTVVVLLQDV